MIVPNPVMKALVTLAIEATLLDVGKSVYDTVTTRLYKKYDCYTSDCFEKPEYLREVLKELYAKSYNEIVNSIQEELKEINNNKKIETFLQVLS